MRADVSVSANDAEPAAAAGGAASAASEFGFVAERRVMPRRAAKTAAELSREQYNPLALVDLEEPLVPAYSVEVEGRGREYCC